MNTIIVGNFGAPYGVKGWLKVNAFTEIYTDILNYQPWFIKTPAGLVNVEIEKSRPHGSQIIVKLRGCDTPEAARAYTNKDIIVDKELLPKLTANEYYWHDLEGLNVVTVTGVKLGTVSRLIATGANDVLVVEGDRRRLIPYTKDAVLTVELAKQQLIVDWDPDF